MRERIEEALRDYHWMVKEIKRLRSMLHVAGENVTQQYGIESTMPKGKGTISDPIHIEVERRSKLWKRLEKLENKVLLIQNKMDLITDERERTVLDCIMDGMSMIAISNHMGLSRRHIHRIKSDIVDKMSHMSHLAHCLSNEKRVG